MILYNRCFYRIYFLPIDTMIPYFAPCVAPPWNPQSIIEGFYNDAREVHSMEPTKLTKAIVAGLKSIGKRYEVRDTASTTYAMPLHP